MSEPTDDVLALRARVAELEASGMSLLATCHTLREWIKALPRPLYTIKPLEWVKEDHEWLKCKTPFGPFMVYASGPWWLCDCPGRHSRHPDKKAAEAAAEEHYRAAVAAMLVEVKT